MTLCSGAFGPGTLFENQTASGARLDEGLHGAGHYKDRPDPPWHELFVPEALRASLLARRNAQQQIEDLFTDLLYRRFAVRDTAGIHVHVVAHALVSERLLEILITGMVGNPIALPRPVVNAMRFAPPAASPVNDAGS